MGCGCGGGSRRNVKSSVRKASQPGRLSSGVNARQVQVQSNQRQALMQSARETAQTNGQIQALGSVSPAQNFNLGEQEAERKRRVQISLRSRNTRSG